MNLNKTKILYEASGTIDFRPEIVINFILNKDFETEEEAYKFKFKSFFTKENGEVILKVINEKTKELLNTIRSEDLTNYSLVIFDKTTKVKTFKECCLENGFTEKTIIDKFKNYPVHEDHNYKPCFLSFDEIFKNKNLLLKEGEKFYFECESWNPIKVKSNEYIDITIIK